MVLVVINDCLALHGVHVVMATGTATVREHAIQSCARKLPILIYARESMLNPLRHQEYSQVSVVRFVRCCRIKSSKKMIDHLFLSHRICATKSINMALPRNDRKGDRFESAELQWLQCPSRSRNADACSVALLACVLAACRGR